MKLDEYFDNEGWDQHDTLVFSFYNCRLKTDWFGHTAGSTVKCIDIDFDSGTIEFHHNDTTRTHSFKVVPG